MSRAAAATDTFTAVADPTRGAILDQLRGGSLPVGELASGFRLSVEGRK
jgi:DNA-binding transcriptional ArsR family regulator